MTSPSVSSLPIADAAGAALGQAFTKVKAQVPGLASHESAYTLATGETVVVALEERPSSDPHAVVFHLPSRLVDAAGDALALPGEADPLEVPIYSVTIALGLLADPAFDLDALMEQHRQIAADRVKVFKERTLKLRGLARKAVSA